MSVSQAWKEAVRSASSRRSFLRRLGASLGTAFLGSGTPLLAGETARSLFGNGSSPADPRVFDLHAHPGLFPAEGTPFYPGDEAGVTTVEAGLEAGLAGAFFSVVGDLRVLGPGPEGGLRPVRSFEPGEAWADYRRQIRVLRALLGRSPTQTATRADQVRGTDSAPARLAAFVACEGGDVLEGRPERLETLYEDGVRSLQLVHYAQNELGDLQTEPPRFDGLSETGRDVVREMNRLGMVVDVAHASFRTTVDVADASEHPIMLSHSLLKTGSDAALEARLVTPEHARVVADTGGVVGAWPAGGINGNLDDFVENTLRLVETVGVEHVGLGTDMDAGPDPVLSDYGQLPPWIDGLRSAGLSEEEVAGVSGGNALRLLDRVAGQGKGP